jgi:hypothetical protein
MRKTMLLAKVLELRLAVRVVSQCRRKTPSKLLRRAMFLRCDGVCEGYTNCLNILCFIIETRI